ncbi:V4R domain-containing protein [Chloroflexota bacterium]
MECAGIVGLKQGICYYHAGTFAGILSGLLNRDLVSFETDCHASGNDFCRFTIGDAADEEMINQFDTYMSPPEVNADIVSRLEKRLSDIPALFNNGQCFFYRKGLLVWSL